MVKPGERFDKIAKRKLLKEFEEEEDRQRAGTHTGMVPMSYLHSIDSGVALAEKGVFCLGHSLLPAPA